MKCNLLKLCFQTFQDSCLQIKKMEAFEETKEAQLKAVGFKRPLWGGHQTEIFVKDHARLPNFGLPVPSKHEVGDKVNLSL